MAHPVWNQDSVAVITGGASGIGLAAAKRFASMGLRVCIADIGADRLQRAHAEIAAASKLGTEGVFASETDVSKRDDLVVLQRAVRERFGGVDVLMNNAGIGMKSGVLAPIESWQRTIDVNLWGVIHGTQVFVPEMVERGRPGIVVNTGSKQGITTPPGNPAYNVSKAGVKAFTEALEHELRNTREARVRAHLLIPGFVFTSMTSGGQSDKPDGAWTPEQTVDFMIAAIDRGDFYILCPDNEVPRALDERRILWAAGDLVENRPPLSRWHPAYAEEFALFAATAKK